MVKKKYVGLSSAERSEIEILISKGYSYRKIAKALGRSPNTISREVSVNSVTDNVTGIKSYIAFKAKAKSRLARRSRRHHWQKIEENTGLRKYVIKHLKLHWSPHEISGYLKDNKDSPELGFTISGKQIYGWLYSSRGQRYCRYLYSERFRPRVRRKIKQKRIMIPDRTPLSLRPLSSQNRSELGHYEFDSIVSSKRSGSTFVLAVAQERSTRHISAKLMPSLHPKEFAGAIVALLGSHNTIRSLTADNGIENKYHRIITNKLTGNPVVFFTDPYSSWQKGGIENANKMLRRYFPKGTDFSKVNQSQVDRVVDLINKKPRKILGFKSAIQLAKEKGLFRNDKCPTNG